MDGIGQIINGILVVVGGGIILMAIKGVLSLQKLDTTVKQNTEAQAETREELKDTRSELKETVNHNSREHAHTRTMIGNLDTRLVKVEDEVHHIRTNQKEDARQ